MFDLTKKQKHRQCVIECVLSLLLFHFNDWRSVHDDYCKKLLEMENKINTMFVETPQLRKEHCNHLNVNLYLRTSYQKTILPQFIS